MKNKVLTLAGLSLALAGPAYGQDFDVDVKLKTRPAPLMPARAQTSGKCDIAFDVDIEGITKNIKAKACTDEVFYLPSIRSIQKTIFEPATKDGQPVIREDLSLIHI